MTIRPASSRNPLDLGTLVIDPRDKYVREIIPFCIKGSPTSCLISTVASAEVGRRLTVDLNHITKTGRIGVTLGDYRYERPLNKNEYNFAAKFDNGNATLLRKAVEIPLHLQDGTWSAKPKAVGGGSKTSANRNGNGKPATKSHRARSLELARKRWGQ